MPPLYHQSMYDDSAPVPSYWESSADPVDLPGEPLESEESCDVAVIGGGFTGLSTALHLARDYGVDVRVLEAGHIGWGASGRNGGMCCLAATKLSIEGLVERYGLAETKRFYGSQLEGMSLLESLIDEEGISCDRQGDGVFEVAHHPSRFGEFGEYGDTLRRLFGLETKIFDRHTFRETGHDSTEQFGAILVKPGFALHPLKLSIGLALAAARHGAWLHPRTRVLTWTRVGGYHHLHCAAGRLKARRVVVATNGFTRDELHPAFDGVTLPAISNILTTRPLTDDELASHLWRTENPLCNTRNLLFYYRLLRDRRLLFGARGDATGHPASATRMRQWMTRRLGEVFPHWRDIPTTHFWRGLVCMTRRLTPCVGRLEEDPSVWYGFGYHGNGVNTAPWVGMVLARNMAGRSGEYIDLPAPIAGLSPRFPLPRLRLWALRAAYLYYQYQDWR